LEKTLNLKGIAFPISLENIRKFAKNNSQLKIKINILYRNLNKRIYPYECGIGCGPKIINLLMVEKKFKLTDTVELVRHFLAITDVKKYLNSKYTNKNKKYSYSKSEFCLSCFNRFSNVQLLKTHERICHSKKSIIEDVPSAGKTIRFKNFVNQHMQNYIGFLDFECLLRPETVNPKCVDCRSIRCKCDKSFTEIINHQEPFALQFCDNRFL